MTIGTAWGWRLGRRAGARGRARARRFGPSSLRADAAAARRRRSRSPPAACCRCPRSRSDRPGDRSRSAAMPSRASRCAKRAALVCEPIRPDEAGIVARQQRAAEVVVERMTVRHDHEGSSRTERRAPARPDRRSAIALDIGRQHVGEHSVAGCRPRSRANGSPASRDGQRLADVTGAEQDQRRGRRLQPLDQQRTRPHPATAARCSRLPRIAATSRCTHAIDRQARRSRQRRLPPQSGAAAGSRPRPRPSRESAPRRATLFVRCQRAECGPRRRAARATARRRRRSTVQAADRAERCSVCQVRPPASRARRRFDGGQLELAAADAAGRSRLAHQHAGARFARGRAAHAGDGDAHERLGACARGGELRQPVAHAAPPGCHLRGLAPPQRSPMRSLRGSTRASPVQPARGAHRARRSLRRHRGSHGTPRSPASAAARPPPWSGRSCLRRSARARAGARAHPAASRAPPGSCRSTARACRARPRPSHHSSSLVSQPAPCRKPPSTCPRSTAGFNDVPASCRMSTRSSRSSPVSVSTATSDTAAP